MDKHKPKRTTNVNVDVQNFQKKILLLKFITTPTTYWVYIDIKYYNWKVIEDIIQACCPPLSPISSCPPPSPSLFSSSSQLNSWGHCDLSNSLSCWGVISNSSTILGVKYSSASGENCFSESTRCALISFVLIIVFPHPQHPSVIFTLPGTSPPYPHRSHSFTLPEQTSHFTSHKA